MGKMSNNDRTTSLKIRPCMYLLTLYMIKIMINIFNETVLNKYKKIKLLKEVILFCIAMSL